MGSMSGGASEEFASVSESDCALVVVLLAVNGPFLGVLCGVMCLIGDAGDDGGEDSWVGARAKRALFAVVGGVVVRCCGRGPGERSLLKDEYGFLCAVLRLDRRGEYGS